MEYFCAIAQRFAEVRRAYRLYHEFLDIDVIVGMLAAIDDIHHRHRHAELAKRAVQVCNVRIERFAGSYCRSTRSGQRYRKD